MRLNDRPQQRMLVLFRTAVNPHLLGGIILAREEERRHVPEINKLLGALVDLFCFVAHRRGRPETLLDSSLIRGRNAVQGLRQSNKVLEIGGIDFIAIRLWELRIAHTARRVAVLPFLDGLGQAWPQGRESTSCGKALQELSPSEKRVVVF